jgi:hypothetical protein
VIHLNSDLIFTERVGSLTVIKRNTSNTQDLIKSLRETRHQIQTSSVDSQRVPKRGYSEVRNKEKRVPKSSDLYMAYLKKKAKLTEDNIDIFKTCDLVYYFKDKSNEAGSKYVIANFKRDMAVFKKAQERYSVRDILLMIEFLFDSEQDYIAKKTAQPTILVSNWANTLLPDAELWLEGKFVPRKQQKHSNREWTGDTSKEEVIIDGDWGF